MIAWLLLVVLTAGVNLFAFLAFRGRWGPLVPFLVVAALVGTVAGNAVGRRLGVDLLRIGDFDFAAASAGAEAAMLATLLLAAIAPASTPPADEP
jgi:hypothetical protein